MATIDLGKIKQVWRGTWSNSPNPAYSVDDLVEYTDTGVTSTYIAVSTPGSQVPSSGGSVQSNWNLVAKGIADPIPTQGGNAGKFLKTNGSALSFASAGGVLGIKETIIDTLYGISTNDWTTIHSSFKVDYTATSATSHFLLEAYLALGMNSHDDLWTCNWFDSLKGTSSSDKLFATSTASPGTRATGTFALQPGGAAVSAGWNNYWLSGQYVGVMYYPASAQRSTNARSFYPCFLRNGYGSSELKVNHNETNHIYGMIGRSVLRVTELEGGIVQ